MAPLVTLILLVGSSLVHAEPTMRERAKSYRLRGIYPPVNAHHRGELVEICNLLGLTGNAAEIGVFHGGFSRHNLLHGQWKKCKLTSTGTPFPLRSCLRGAHTQSTFGCMWWQTT